MKTPACAAGYHAACPCERRALTSAELRAAECSCTCHARVQYVGDDDED